MTTTFDALNASHTATNGGLTITNNVNSVWSASRSTATVSSGKWYFEIVINVIDAARYTIVGAAVSDVTQYPGQPSATSWGYSGDTGAKYSNGTSTAYGTTFIAGDVIGVALDLDNGRIFFAKNNTWQASGDPETGTNPAYSGISGSVKPAVGMYRSTNQVTGQFLSTDLTYDPPDGYLAYDQSGDVLVTLEQPWGDVVPIHGYLAQPWPMPMASALSQPYVDGSTMTASCYQPLLGGYAAVAGLVHLYDDAASLRASVAQSWDLLGVVSGELAQPWPLLGSSPLATLSQEWSLLGRDMIAADLRQPYTLVADAALIDQSALTATVDGVALDPVGITIESQLDQYVISATIELADHAGYLSCKPGAAISITLAGQTFSLRVEGRSRNREHGSAEYTVAALSPAAWLDAPYVETATGEYSGLASTIATTLAAPLACGWQTVDWLLPAATLLAGEETPLAILRRLAAAVGAVIQSHPDGSMVALPSYPVRLPDWPAAAIDATLSDDGVFTAREEYDHRPGYNRYLISDELTSADSVRLESEDIDQQRKVVRGYRTPWGDISLRHTGGSWVGVNAQGAEEREVEEVVEFVAGEGRVKFPIYDRISMEWRQTALGTITHSEDGLLRADTDGESLLAITYLTRCWKWEVRSPQIEQVQVVAEVEP